MRYRTPSLVLAAAILVAAPLAAQSWKFDVHAGDKLVVDLDTGGSIEIRGDDSSQVTISADVQGRDAEDIRVTATAFAGGVRITSDYTTRKRNRSGSADLVITVPSKFDLELESMGGGIRIGSIEGKIKGSTMGGEIRLNKVRGRVDLSTMGGEIEVTDSVADGEVSTMGGNVVFEDVEGGLKGSTMGGNVRIGGKNRVVGAGSAAVRSGDEVVEITSMGGRINVAAAPAGAKVSTMGGGITIDSASRFVDATTMGGEIVIREVDGKVKASTMGGDVTVRVVGAGGAVEIESMSGDIELELPSGFSATFDIELDYTRNSRRSYEIRSDFPLQTSESAEWSREGHKGTPRKTISGRGTSGDGRHQVRINTVNGNVVIKKGH